MARYRVRIGRAIGSAALVADGLHARTDGFTRLAVLGVADLRIRWIGHTLHAEADLTVTPDLSLIQAHELAHHAETHLLEQVRRLNAATIHTSPAGAH